MKYKFIFSLVLFTLYSCREEKTIEIKNKEGIVIQRITLAGDTSKGKNGIYESFDKNGIPLEYATYSEGKLNGEKRLFEEGKLYSSEMHVNDQYEGPYKVYYPNGKIQLETQYVNNEILGELKSYYNSGNLKEIVQMKSNQEDGPFIEYYDNKNKKAEGNYKEGAKEHGLLMLYDSLGVLIRKMDCDNGTCHTIWTKDNNSNNISK
ncbi:MAG: hypothetical protein ABI851_00130 [Saprospiraceae bacterium]